ncbi:MAG: hypothetical protein Q9220_001828 [cf. Caloplaca sp. 1 TL-2023]
MGIHPVVSLVMSRSFSPDGVAFDDKHSFGQPPFPQSFNGDIHGRKEPYSGLSTFFSSLSLATTVAEDERGGEIEYTDLPKIRLREQSFLSGMVTLNRQFVSTMVFFRRHLVRRALSPKGPVAPPQRSYQVIHLHTNEEKTLNELAGLLMLQPSWDKYDIPAIFPLAPQKWELIVEASYLKKLRGEVCFGQSTTFIEPPGMPKGLMGRAAQVASVVLDIDSWVSAIYLDLIQGTPWHRMMKDTAESLTVHHTSYAMLGDHIYEL